MAHAPKKGSAPHFDTNSLREQVKQQIATYSELEKMAMKTKFHRAMVRIYEEAKKAGYTPSYFLRMLGEHGGVETARRLINSNTPSEGFTRLWLMKRLDLTVESLVLQPEWESLFTDEERARARKRLKEYGRDI